MSDSLVSIHKAVEKAAECSARHVESTAVVEGYRNQVVWQGIVEVFELSGHAKAKRAYGWQDGERFVAVLEIPPVDSPNTAVRAAIIAKSRK